MKQKNNLGTDSTIKLVLKLAIPSMLAQLVNVLYGIIDRMYIGNIPEIGDVALAGVGICNPIVTLISSFAFLIGLGGAPLVAMRLGEKNIKGAKQILSNCFIMLIFLSIVLTTIFLLVKKPLLLTFGASTTTFVYANDYLSIYIIGTIFAILSMGLNQFIVCQGFSTIGMTTILIGAILNIILDPIFIFSLNLGVKGAAYATITSQAASAIFVIIFLSSKVVDVGLSIKDFSTKIIKRVITFGMSPFIIIATDSILILIMNLVLQKYGGIKEGDLLITCATIVQSYMQIIIMPLGGLTGGTQPILSYNFGAKNINKIKETYKCVTIFGLLYTSIMFILTILFSKYFVTIFTNNIQLINLSIWAIRVYTLCIIPLSLQYVIVDGFTALGIANIAIKLSLTRKSMFLIFTIVIPMYFGGTYTFFTEPLSDLISSIISIIIYTLTIKNVLLKRELMPEGEALYS